MLCGKEWLICLAASLGLLGCGELGNCPILDGTSLPGDYGDCIEGRGDEVAASASSPAFCALRFERGATEFDECVAIGGDVAQWEYSCANGRFMGGTYCLLFYLEHSCPTVNPPTAFLPSPPACD